MVHNDYENLPGKNGLPEGHAGVSREMVVPVVRNKKVVAILGIGNKPANYTDLDVETVTFLADIGWELAEQKMKQELLIQSEERFARLFERAPLGYQSLDENGNLIEINEAWAKTLGYSKKEVIGKWFGDFLQADYVEHFRERFPQFKQAGKVHSEFKMTHRDGMPRDITFDGQIGYKNDGSFEKTHCILQDVTEQRLMEKKLRESEEKMRSIFRVAPTGIGVVSDGKFMEVNPSFCEMTGYSKEELIGRGTRLLYAAQEEYDRIGKEIYRQIAQKGFGTQETSWQKKEGSSINVILSETVIDSNGHSNGFTFNALDITERKKAEMELKRKMDELEKFNRIMVGRENKMIELKLEINELLSKMNLSRKYNPQQITDGS